VRRRAFLLLLALLALRLGDDDRRSLGGCRMREGDERGHRRHEGDRRGGEQGETTLGHGEDVLGK
jgi:hypothetical protein